MSVALLLAATQRGWTRNQAAAAPPRAAPPLVERVFDTAHGLLPGWSDYGWVPRSLAAGAPVSLDFSRGGGWIVAHPPALAGPFGGLRFTVRASAAPDTFLEVYLDDSLPRSFPRVKLAPAHRLDRPGEAWSVWIPMAELNPQRAGFDRVVFRAIQPVNDMVELDEIGFTAEVPPPAPALAAPALPTAAPATTVAPLAARFVLDCAVPAHPIDPMIYGIGFDPRRDGRESHQWLMGASARRWGGNPSSRYNWELGNAWNTGADWFFQNVNYSGQPGDAWLRFLTDNRRHGVKSALSVPIQGWVAKDTRSYSFPVGEFGAQQRSAPENPDAGNGVSRDGRPIPPGAPTRTSVAAPPEWIARWAQAVRAREREGERGVDLYILDNEPMLWNSTHRDVHPEPTGYDELLERTLSYGGALRAADPRAVIAAPALWGWPAYMYSAIDQVSGFAARPDRRAHGDVPFLPWWLARLREHEQRTGTRPVDVVDVHFYPNAEGVGGLRAAADPATAARRLRSTRGLWDPEYVDESWVAERIMLVPRLRRWIQENNPGLDVSIGEWNFGAETHMSGGLATAEALGRFGLLSLRAAFYWDYPPEGSPTFWAFRAYRDFDGQGGRFLDLSVPVRAPEGAAGPPSPSLFASRDQRGERVVAVLLNFDPRRALEARIEAGRCGALGEPRIFGFTGAAAGFAPQSAGAREPGALDYTAPPYSITVFDLPLQPADPVAPDALTPAGAAR